MIVIGNNVYVSKSAGYAKCVLHKKQVRDRAVFSLEETTSAIKTLPADYAVMTFQEIIAKFGHIAVDDDAPSKEEKGEK